MANKSYMVEGDLSADKSSDNYPVMTLCDDCKDEYEIIQEEGPSSEPCESCGEQ